GIGGIERLGHAETIELGHLDIEEDDIGTEGVDLLERLETIGGGANDDDVVLARQQALQVAPHDRLVVDQQDPHPSPPSRGISMMVRTIAPSLTSRTVPRSPYRVRRRSRVVRSPTPSRGSRASGAPSLATSRRSRPPSIAAETRTVPP